ncbi:MAG: hypothetical protein R3320_03725 [Nitriliruptorales bacterium]|nr:hypothetical protein [Nitriliruptorales bacterium]
MFSDRFASFEREVSRPGPDDVRTVAAIYREWRDVLSAPLDVLPPRSLRALGPLNDRVRRAVERTARGRVSDRDLEDATMAAWLALLAATDQRQRRVVELLAHPWREATRSIRDRPARLSRTQRDRVSFPSLLAN